MARPHNRRTFAAKAADGTVFYKSAPTREFKICAVFTCEDGRRWGRFYQTDKLNKHLQKLVNEGKAEICKAVETTAYK